MALPSDVPGVVSAIDAALQRRELPIFKEEGDKTKECLLHFSIFETVARELKAEGLAQLSACGDALKAAGSLLGTAVGDSLGAVLEFQDVVDYGEDQPAADWQCSNSACPALTLEGRACFLSASLTCCPYCQSQREVDTAGDQQRGLDIKTGEYHGKITNQFMLKPGQWTDDTSMALCVADSLLCRRGFDGSDLRQRFYSWCFGAYNTPFGQDPRRTFSDGMAEKPATLEDCWFFDRGAIGCGKNMSAGLEKLAAGCVGERPPPVYKASTEDAGNAPLIRIAALPIFFHSRPVEELLEAARASSYCTHPGSIAAECCAALAFIIRSALVREPGEDNMRLFLDATTEVYCEMLSSEGAQEGPSRKDGNGSAHQARASILELLRSPSTETAADSSDYNSSELGWCWRVENTRWGRTLTNRGDYYNGYPVSSNYVGSFAFDGLAMALWAAYHTTSFDDAIERCVNLQGDADSTAAICGALCGAFYGLQAIHPRLVASVQRWDDGGDIALRGFLLWEQGRRYDGAPPAPLAPLDLVKKDGTAASCTMTSEEVIAWVNSLPDAHVPGSSKEFVCTAVKEKGLTGESFTEFAETLGADGSVGPRHAMKLRSAWKKVLEEVALRTSTASA